MKPLIELRDLHTSYGGKNVLKGISFKIFKGDRVGLIGNNGAGKSTTINVLCNLHPYENGIYLFDGDEVDSHSVSFKKDLGIVLSNPFYIEEFTIQEYLLFLAKMFGISRDRFDERFNKWVSRFNIDDLVDEKISNLSSGEKMKVSIIASLIHDPGFLIYDEPFTHLDVISVEVLKNFILQSKGKTVLLASNKLNECLDICNRFLIMENGKIQYSFRKGKDDDEESVKEKVRNIMVNKDNELLEWL